MRELIGLFLLVFLFSVSPASAADISRSKHFTSRGEVISVDPMYSRITLQHDPIKGFPGGFETEFEVSSQNLLKNISMSDEVTFEIEEAAGSAQIIKLERTGKKFEHNDRMPMGRAAQDLLEGASTVVKTVTSPIAPVNQLTSAATDATTSATGSVLADKDSEVKAKF
jgi:Cu/Ag efflux protein CusF